MSERRGVDRMPPPRLGGGEDEPTGYNNSEKSKHTSQHERSSVNPVVITGLVPVIHVLLSLAGSEDVDGRVKPGHDSV
jgi:hypothetical protein